MKIGNIIKLIILMLLIIFTVFPGGCTIYSVGFPAESFHSISKILINIIVMSLMISLLIFLYRKIKLKNEFLTGVKLSSVYIIGHFIFFYIQVLIFFIFIYTDIELISNILDSLYENYKFIYMPAYYIVHGINNLILRLNNDKALILINRNNFNLVMNKISYVVNIFSIFAIAFIIKYAVNKKIK